MSDTDRPFLSVAALAHIPSPGRPVTAVAINPALPLPKYEPPCSMLPDARPIQLEPLHTPAEADRIRVRRRAARVYVAQQNAIDAPFADMERERAGLSPKGRIRASASAERSDAEPEALGFITNATKGEMTPLFNRHPVRERILVNREAARIKRMQKSVGHAARLLHFDAHTERNAQLWNKKFITLTYADADAWQPGHIGAFRRALRDWCRSRRVRLRFVWVAELQKRGALHYHIVVWLPKGKFLPHADACGWWPHGMTNIVNAQSPIGYITKYASKTTTSEASRYPKGARMCGHGGLEPEGRRHVRYWLSPIWVRDALTGRADIRKVNGGYMNKITGEFLPSPWRVEVAANGQVWAYRIDNQPTELAA